MRSRSKLKPLAMRKFFRHMLGVRVIRVKHVNMPFQIAVDDLLTGHMGDKMHEELYQLAKKRGFSSRRHDQ